ncbi:MAG TPA: CpXC domain-containing protein [Anaerolineales bacterium]|jgi:DNA-binding NarL/FixJ family response regulator
MAQAVTQISCPNCRGPIQAEITQAVDARENPGAKSRLLSGALNRVQCPTCGYQGQLATPLVYHDSEKELLLTYMPAEVAMPKNEQEKLLGRLINRIVDNLPQESRKAYLLQPKASLTMQGLIEQVLEADGITKEQIEHQQAKLRLVEQLIRQPSDQVEAFVLEHDVEMDEDFFQLASMALQSLGDEQALAAAAQRLEAALRLSSVGKRIEARESELRAAAESLQSTGEGLTQERLLELFIEAPNDDRVIALANLSRPALDYGFFQQLSDRIEAANAEQKTQLEALRARVLEITQQIDDVQQARAAQAAGLLRSLIEAEDLDEAIRQAFPLIDEIFLATLRANLTAAKESGNEQAAARLETIQSRINQVVMDSLPPSLQLAQRVLDVEDLEAGKALLDDNAEAIDEQFLSTLVGAAQRLDQGGDAETAERIRKLHRHAAGQTMRRNLKK